VLSKRIVIGNFERLSIRTRIASRLQYDQCPYEGFK